MKAYGGPISSAFTGLAVGLIAFVDVAVFLGGLQNEGPLRDLLAVSLPAMRQTVATLQQAGDRNGGLPTMRLSCVG
jgi:hypothetical protein